MALNSSGAISLGGSTSGQSINLELGQSATTQISLNDSNVRTLAGVASGAITMPTNFYGKATSTASGMFIFGSYQYNGDASVAENPNGNAYFTGTYVVPADVTTLSAVCIGAGGSPAYANYKSTGGGGGALAYATFAVTPGETLTWQVGNSSSDTQRGDSGIFRGATALVYAQGGLGNGSPGAVTTGSGYSGGAGGGWVGTVGSAGGPGGGGAGGYYGVGGAGGNANWDIEGAGTAGQLSSGGGGDGGGGSGRAYDGISGTPAGGGGVGPFVYVARSPTATPVASQGGNSGNGYQPQYGITGSQSGMSSDGLCGGATPQGGVFGGGAGSNDTVRSDGEQAGVGAVRIIIGKTYPTGLGRFYPNTSPWAVASGQTIYEHVITTTGSGTWTVPTGVTSISVACLGAGGAGRRSDTQATGGGGGGLRWYNNLTVVPGNTYSYSVGAGGTSSGAAGGDTCFGSTSAAGAIVYGGGGAGGPASTSGGAGGTGSNIGGSIGGYNGGQGGNCNTTYAGGGGGAAGYFGAGGNGANYTLTTAQGGTGGSGGGGATHTSTAGGGGGIGLYIGVDGYAATGTNGNGGGGGGFYYTEGGGTTRSNFKSQNYPTQASQANATGQGGRFGGGGGGSDNNTGSPGAGGNGFIRIIWPGVDRQFPGKAGE